MVKLGNHDYKLMVSNSLDFYNNSLSSRKSTKCLYLQPFPNSSFRLEHSLCCLLALYSVSYLLVFLDIPYIVCGEVKWSSVGYIWYDTLFGVWTSVFPILVSCRAHVVRGNLKGNPKNLTRIPPGVRQHWFLSFYDKVVHIILDIP